jgi:hypothetical protein
MSAGFMRRLLAPLTLAVLGLAAQDLPPEVLMLARIRATVGEAVGQLPDCTCLETVMRLVQPAAKKARPLDTVVLQVLFSGGQELFASPGDTHWDKDPSAFLTGGLIGNGLFALFLQSVFLNNQSVIKYHGMESSRGRTEARYDFTISQMRSGYVIRNASATGVVGMSGSFWADPQSYDLQRLEIHAVDIPPQLLYADISTSIQYNRVRIGASKVLLPEEAALQTVASDGAGDHDLVEFTHCHGFQTESAVHFDAQETAPAAATAASRAAGVEEPLPPQLRITAALTTPIDDRSAVGSLVEGKVVGSVMHKGKVLVPDGAPIQGRIRRMERYADAGDYFVVALEFTHIHAPDEDFRFYADLLDTDHRAGVELANSTTTRSQSVVSPANRLQLQTMSVEHISMRDVPGVGTFFIHGPHFSLPSEFKTVWRTRLLPQSGNR